MVVVVVAVIEVLSGGLGVDGVGFWVGGLVGQLEGMQDDGS